MLYHDAVYGEMEINEAVLLELMESPALQRLKGVDSAGYRPLWVKPEMPKPDIENTRWAHSLGVCLLLKKYGAALEEQVAGLIHDVSHASFSHCVDYALAEGSEKNHDHQDNIFDDYVRHTNIPEILKKYGFNPDYILEDANFPLKENKLPDLCADRIDYVLRNARFFDEVTDEEIKNLLDELTVREGRWIFKSFAGAKKYADIFYKMNENYYASLSGAVMNRVVGDYLKRALEKKYVSLADLYTTNKIVLDKIAVHLPDDEKLRFLYERLEGRVKGINDPQNFEAQVFVKSRAVDPLFEQEGKIMRISGSEPAWSEIVEKENQPKEYFVRFLD